MKIRITLLTENDIPADVAFSSKEEAEKTTKIAWDIALRLLMLQSNDPSEKASVESVDILDYKEDTGHEKTSVHG